VVVPAFDRGQVAPAALAAGAGALLAVALGKVAAVFGRRLGAGAMQFRMQANSRRAVVRRYLRLPMSWHYQHPTGELLSNANADVESAWYPIAPLPFAVGTVAMLVVAVVSLALTDPVLALIGLAILPTMVGLNTWYSRKISPRAIRAQQLRAEVSAIAHESFDGALVVKTMGGEAVETGRFAERARQLCAIQIAQGRIRGVFDPIMDALPSLATLLALLVGAIRLRAGAVTLADVISVAFLFTVLGFPVRAIGWLLADVPRSVAGWDRLHRVLRATGDVRYGDLVLPADQPAALRFDRVSYSYLDGPAVVEELSFEVPQGSTVALVGSTGSGKSTIAALATRLVDPSSGRITLGGVALDQLTRQSLADCVALVPQVPFVFDDTLRGNIGLDRPGLTDQQLWQALELAQLAETVSALPEGLDTRVGERGTSLSGGQRQRLTLARAGVGHPRLLVLDDATSAVDPRVEAQILAGLRACGAETTLLVVAYRLATIALADQVIYLEGGRVMARGTHQELLAAVPSYAELVTAYERAAAGGQSPGLERTGERVAAC
jgi:ATP-binding cassette, subfamily B, bacterial